MYEENWPATFKEANRRRHELIERLRSDDETISATDYAYLRFLDEAVRSFVEYLHPQRETPPVDELYERRRKKWGLD